MHSRSDDGTLLTPAERRVVPLQALWSTAQLGVFLSISPRTLRSWRAAGFGPAWVRQGRFVRYDPAEVRRWLAEDCSWHSATSTSWSPTHTGGGDGSRPESGACLDASPEAVTLPDRRGGDTPPPLLHLVRPR
jgi:hypothetical protein